MTYYIAIVIQNGYKMYLSRVNPITKKILLKGPWVAYIGPEQAHQFKTKEQAMDANADFIKDKPWVGLCGVAEVNFYRVDNSQVVS
jgi:hypothetical protein